MALKSLLTVKNPTAQLARHLDFLADYDFTLEHRPGRAHQNCDALSRLRPCTDGPNSEPCKQCKKLVTGEHVNTVTTRRQAKTQPLFAPVFDVINTTVVENDDDLSDDDLHDVIDDVTDHERSGDGLQGDHPDRSPVGLLGRVAPAAAANLQAWDPAALRARQLEDADIAGALNSIESNKQPSWAECQSVSPALRALFQQYDSLVILNGVLYRAFYNVDGSVKCYQLILPHVLKQDFLQLIHNDLAGHMCVKKCRPEIQKRAWWHRWKSDLDLFVRCCDRCNSYHRGKAPKQGLLHPMALGQVASRWSVDLAGEFPSSNGYKYIFTAICPFSKYAIAVPVRNKNAKTIARVIVEKILLTHSLAHSILSDNGGEFCNQLADELYKILGVHRLHTTSRKASTNGCVERLHKSLNSIFAKVVDESHSDWSNLLSYVVFTYNITVHSATGFSPFYVMYGREPIWNIDMLLHNIDERLQSVPLYTASVIERMRTAHSIVRNNIGRQAAYMSQWYNKNVKTAEFLVGDQVRVFNDAPVTGRCPKWQNSYRDVAVVVKRFNDVTYLLRCPSWRADRVVHVDKMKKINTFPE